jgi:ferrochelatase
MTLSVVEPYYEEPSFLDALAETMAAGFESGCWSCHRDQVTVLFSAHSLPRRFVLKTKDPYPQQIEATCRAVMRRSFPNNPWELAYQSKVGRMVWLGPTTDGLLHYFSATETDNLLIVPVAFVSDHSETLYEIDIQYAELAEQLGLKHVHRAPALNSRPPFIHLLAQLVQRELEKLSQPSAPTMMVL